MCLKHLKFCVKSLRGARQHMAPKSNFCAKIQDCCVAIRKLVFLLFSGGRSGGLLEKWEHEGAGSIPDQPELQHCPCSAQQFESRGVCELPEALFQRDSYSCKRVTRVTSGHSLILVFGILRKVLSRTVEPLQGI